ncbi:nuclear transport factor 2 family protein [Streptomyces sp. NBC_01474]|nr:nuclear transport factor 2 family protein [Streptomyces sp. NBC_01474]WSE00652.1 nuclear transport factor 2 family protein [Streptomyces sp. NBC_01474]
MWRCLCCAGLGSGDRCLSHFAGDVTFRSPVAAQLLGNDGVIRGKDALRAYWAEGLRRIPDLQIEAVGSYVGLDSLDSLAGGGLPAA